MANPTWTPGCGCGPSWRRDPRAGDAEVAWAAGDSGASMEWVTSEYREALETLVASEAASLADHLKAARHLVVAMLRIQPTGTFRGISFTTRPLLSPPSPQQWSESGFAQPYERLGHC